MPIGDSEYSTLIILQLATATRGRCGLMLSLLELLDPESANSSLPATFSFLNATVPWMQDA